MRWRRRGAEDGQAGVEAALSIPVFLSIFMLNLYLGLYGYNIQRAQMAARYAAWFENRGDGNGIQRAQDAFWDSSMVPDIAKIESTGASSISTSTISSVIGQILDFIGGGITARKATYKQEELPYASPYMVGERFVSGHREFEEKTAEAVSVFMGDPYQDGIFDLIMGILGL